MGNINIEMFKIKNENERLQREFILHKNSTNGYDRKSIPEEIESEYTS
jgi:hypothetical protein